MHCLVLSCALKRHYRSNLILHGNNRNKNELCPFGKILFLCCCASSVLFNTSVVIKINLFSFRLNGLKSNSTIFVVSYLKFRIVS